MRHSKKHFRSLVFSEDNTKLRRSGGVACGNKCNIADDKEGCHWKTKLRLVGLLIVPIAVPRCRTIVISLWVVEFRGWIFFAAGYAGNSITAACVGCLLVPPKHQMGRVARIRLKGWTRQAQVFSARNGLPDHGEFRAIHSMGLTNIQTPHVFGDL
ncbi:hypothetical protein BD779DRAFT_1473450 [Infundibulicybe gibba]|nr:hypothetical protein BD779DRAFT_1473450 [Infundibulicybe gibba]